MRVSFDAAGVMSLEGIDELHTFEARAACTLALVDRAVEGAGRRESVSHLWIDKGWLIANGRPDDLRWRSAVEAMIAYAASKGWVSPNGEIRAHLSFDRESGAS
jgi:hypothetical protein